MLENLKSNKASYALILVIGVLYWIFAFELHRSEFLKIITLFVVLFLCSFKLLQLNPSKFWFLVLVGIVFRLLFIGVLPNLSQDFFRFIWDGRLVIQGINPYLFTPEQFLQETSSLWEGVLIQQANELYTGMGALNGSHYSNYPPINQLCFAIGALFSGNSILGSAIVFRLLIILADIGILFYGRKLLRSLKQNPNKIFWYFLNPFILIELTGNLHFESVMLFFVIASIYYLQQSKWILAAVLLGLSVSVKLIPLLFLPLFFQWFFKEKNKLRGFINLSLFYTVCIATVLLTFLPFLSNQFVANFSETIGLWFQNFEFNASIYYIIRWIGYQVVGWNIIATVGKILPIVIVISVLLLTFFRDNKSIIALLSGMVLSITIYYLLSTTVHPWYIATPLLLSVFTKYRFALLWSFTIMFSYSAYGANGFSENLYWVAIEYILVLTFLIWELKRNKKMKVLS